MTLDSLIAILGLAIAVYQIIPRARQLDLKLRIHIADWVLITSALAAIFYLQFFSFFAAIGVTPRLGLSRWNLTAERVSFLVVIVTAVLVGIRLRFARLSTSRVRLFKRLVDELLASDEFSELIALLESHLKRLLRIVKNDLPLSRLRQYLIPQQDFVAFLQEFERAQAGVPLKQPSRVQSAIRRVLSPIARRLPAQPAYLRETAELAQTILTSREFARNLARIKPYFGLELLRLGARETRDFLRVFVRALLIEPSTVLHYELLDVPMGDEWYVIDPSKPFLNFFFSDSNVAREYAIWSPIGETVIAELDRVGRDRKTDPYNLPLDGDFEDNEEWQSSLFVAICLFDIMVRQALRHRIEWHMWLYYFPDFTDRIVRNYSLDDPLVESEVNLPIRYSRLLYNIFDTLRNWILLVKHVPADQPNVVLRWNNLDHENENIPKSAIICARFCLHDVLPSDKINYRLKRTILHLFFDLYFDLRASGLDNYAQVLALALRPGGFIIDGEDIRFRNALADGFNSFDRFPHPVDHVGELKAALEVP